jgi:hypothetical protein
MQFPSILIWLRVPNAMARFAGHDPIPEVEGDRKWHGLYLNHSLPQRRSRGGRRGCGGRLPPDRVSRDDGGDRAALGRGVGSVDTGVRPVRGTPRSPGPGGRLAGRESGDLPLRRVRPAAPSGRPDRPLGGRRRARWPVAGDASGRLYRPRHSPPTSGPRLARLIRGDPTCDLLRTRDGQSPRLWGFGVSPGTSPRTYLGRVTSSGGAIRGGR